MTNKIDPLELNSYKFLSERRCLKFNNSKNLINKINYSIKIDQYSIKYLKKKYNFEPKNIIYYI